MNAAEMTSFVCREYGYLPDAALSLPATQFFTLHGDAMKARREHRAVAMADLCDIVSIPMFGAGRYESVRDFFRGLLGAELPQREQPKVLTPEESVNALKSIFGVIHRGR